MDFGKFPWEEIFTQSFGVVLAYFAGRYRKTTVNKTRRRDD